MSDTSMADDLPNPEPKAAAPQVAEKPTESQRRVKAKHHAAGCVYDRLPVWVDYLLLLLITGVASWSNICYSSLDSGPPLSDSATHAEFSVYILEILRDAPNLGFALGKILTLPAHYPPLPYYVNLPFLIWGHCSPQALIAGQIPFLAMLAFGMYHLCQDITNRLAGLTAACLALATPAVLECSRHPFVDMPVAAATALCWAALFKCRGFSRTGWSLTAGLSLGIGIMCKWTFPAFVIIPLLVAVWQALSREWKGHSARERWRLLKHSALIWLIALLYLGICLALFLNIDDGRLGIDIAFYKWLGGLTLTLVLAFICSWRLRKLGTYTSWARLSESLLLMLLCIAPWYIANLHNVVYKFAMQRTVEVVFSQVFIHNLYWTRTWLYLCEYLLPVAIIAGLLKRRTRSATIQLVLSFAVALVSLSWAPSDVRYILPLGVYCYALALMLFSYLGQVALPAMLVFAGISFIQCTYYQFNYPIHFPIYRELVQNFNRAVTPPTVTMPPRTYPYPYRELLDSLHYSADNGISWVFIACPPPEEPRLNTRAFQYYAKTSGRMLYMRLMLEPFSAEIEHNKSCPDNIILVYKPIKSPQPSYDLTINLQETSTREEVLDKLRQTPYWQALNLDKMRSLRTFQFNTDLVVEVLECPQNTKTKIPASVARDREL